MADRGFSGFEYWRDAAATGAQLLWRCPSNRKLPVVKEPEDGSYLSSTHPTGDTKAKRLEQGMVVRVVEYELPCLGESQPRYRLLTTLLDPNFAPALELGTVYHERWKVEESFDELKTHLLHSRRTDVSSGARPPSW